MKGNKQPRVGPGQGQVTSDNPHLPAPSCLVGHPAQTFMAKGPFLMLLPSLCSSGCIFQPLQTEPDSVVQGMATSSKRLPRAPCP